MPPAQLPHDVLLHLLAFASPPTLAAFCTVDRVLGAAATRHLYAAVSLGGHRRMYELFFRAHASRSGGDDDDGGPCRQTAELHLNGTDDDDGGLPDLPHIPRSLFPALERVEVDSAARTLAAVLPILITLDPAARVVFRSPAADELSYAFLPHLALAEYGRVQTVEIRNVDLHPPQLSDYPPNYRFCLPVLPSVRLVVWHLSAALDPAALGRTFFADFFNDLEGAFTDWTPAARPVSAPPLELRLELGRREWVGQAKEGLEHRARGYGIAHVQWERAAVGEEADDEDDWRAQVRGVGVRVRWAGPSSDAGRALAL